MGTPVKSMKLFTDLHHHSEFSLLDGFGSVNTHVKRCCELGHTAVAFTEHGTCRGFVALDKVCEEHKIKPIFGCEVYVCRDHKKTSLTKEQLAAVTAGLKGKEAKEAKAGAEHVEGIYEHRHLILLAENDEGLRNLIKLQNRANTDGFYYYPRIDLNLLEDHSEGIIVNSGCIGGVLAKSFFDGDIDRVIEDVEFFVDVFGDRFSLEIQPHPIDLQVRWNKFVLMLSDEYDIPVVAANDSHYPNPDDWQTHDVLVCMQTKKKVVDCDRMRYEVETFGLKSAEDMIEAFARSHPELPKAVVESAVERSAEIAERCNAKLWKPKKVLLPSVPTKFVTDVIYRNTIEDEELQELCIDGWAWRKLPKGKESNQYQERLSHELEVIEDKGFANYFLIVYEMLNWAREQDILTGPGRGSSAGSLVCYLLGITSLDPIKHGLLFERFLTPGRVDWPDIDCDVEDRRRPEVIQHLRDLYGDDCVAQISTVSRMRAKAALKDVAKAYSLNYSEVDQLTSAIIDEKTRIDPGDSHDTLRKAIENTPALQAFEVENPEVVEHGMKLEGHMRHVGIHPSGIVTSPIPLSGFVPLERRKSRNEVVIVIAYDMRDCEKVGLIKLDLLGLRTLSAVADTVRLVKRRHKDYVNLEELRTDDRTVLDAFTEHDFSGVFQFDTTAMRGACDGVIFDGFEDVVAMNALNRPGPSKSGLADQWRKRKIKKTWDAAHEMIEEICEDTFGVIVYQEHVIRILQELAGYDPVEAGRLRKAISKSKGVGYLQAERPTFVKGAKASGMLEEDADALWSKIEEFGAYGFNRSHSAAYSLIAYWGQWLKINYPIEFFCGLLMNEPDNDKANRFVREASRRGIRICPPDLNVSKTSWTLRGSALVTGIESIKRCGEKACSEIEKHAPFADFPDFVSRVNRRVVNKGVIGAMIKAGALRCLLPNSQWALENFEVLLKRVGQIGWASKMNNLIEASKDEEDFTDDDLWALRLEVGVNGDGRHPLGSVKGLFDGYLRSGFVKLNKAHDGSWVAGVVANFNKGTSRGERWAAIELEDEDGDRIKIKFDDKLFNAYRAVLDVGAGALVAVNIAVSKYGGAKPAVLVNLLEIRNSWRTGEALTPEMALVTAAFHPLQGPERRSDWWRDKKSKVLILNVNTRREKISRRKFAFVRVDAGVGDTYEVVVFASVYEDCRKLLKVGNIVNLRAKREKKGSLIAVSVNKVK